MVKELALKINMEPQSLIPILSASQGDLSIMSEYYDEMGDKIQLASVNSMRYLSELAHGKTECLYQLSQKRSKNFNVSDPALFEAIFNINCIGKRISNKEMTF